VYGLKVWKVIGVCTVHRFLDVVIAVYELCPCCPSRCDIENADVMFTVKEEAEDVDNADKHKESNMPIDRNMEVHYPGQ
jgi:hypothetical protein